MSAQSRGDALTYILPAMMASKSATVGQRKPAAQQPWQSFGLCWQVVSGTEYLALKIPYEGNAAFQDLLRAWHVNAVLEQAGIAARVDHRSLKAQGIDRQPIPHIGRAAWEMERRGACWRVVRESRAAIEP